MIGAVWGAMTYGIQRGNGPQRMGGDFTYPWFAARAILRGVDPYQAAQTAALPWGHNLFYPLPAALVAVPFAWLDARTAAAFFVGFGAALAAFFAARKAWWPLAIFLSAQVYAVAAGANWALLLTAACFAAPLCIVCIAKPNLGLAVLAYQRNWRAFGYATIGGAALLVTSLLILPRWPLEWIGGFRTNPLHAQYPLPIASIWGLPVALAAVRWRDPRAQYLLALACVPQHFRFIDQTLVLLVAGSRAELLALCVASWLAWGATALLNAAPLPAVIIGCYWPALAVVLWHGTRHGVERRVRRSDQSQAPS